MALACGNTYVMKPSERVPGATMMMVKMALDAGVPAGALNVIHGQHDAVNFLCDDPRIKAVSFVGGNRAGEHIFDRATRNGKRAQCNLGAKNHATVMPDADKESTINALVGAAFGAAGQRCMALSTAIFIGDAQQWIPEIVAKARALRVAAGSDPKADLGPLISPEVCFSNIFLIRSSLTLFWRLPHRARIVLRS